MGKESIFRNWIRKPKNIVSALLALFAFSSAIFAGYSAWVATESLDQARDSFQIAQRAYLVVETIQIAELPNLDRPLAAEIVVRNSGITPALNMQFSGRLDVTSITPTDTPREFTDQDGQITLGSNSKRAMRVIGGRALDAQELKEINNDQSKIYVTGTVSYEDIFQQTHETEFCAFFNPNENFDPLFLFACSELNTVG